MEEVLTMCPCLKNHDDTVHIEAAERIQALLAEHLELTRLKMHV